MKNLWEDFYKKTKDEDIPWQGLTGDFYKRAWTKFKLPEKGKVLDVGCGTGNKALSLAKKGFMVWGLDISETAVKRAKAKTEGLENRPKFFRQDVLKLTGDKRLDGVKFDMVFDILCSHFLKNNEKLVYLKALSTYIKPSETYYILVNFLKEKSPPKTQPKWIQDIAMSQREVKDTYGKYFRMVDKTIREEQKGKTVRYILKAR